MTPTGLGYEHRQARAAAIAAMQDGQPCPLVRWCGGKPMFSTPAAAIAAGLPRWLGMLDYDHVIARVLGGSGGPRQLAHSRCNRKAGQLLGAKLRAARNRRYSR